MTNWFDPDSPLVRGVLIVVMLASLLHGDRDPDAFGDRAALFAGLRRAPGRPQRLCRAGRARVAATRDDDRHPRLVDTVAPLWIVGAFLDHRRLDHLARRPRHRLRGPVRRVLDPGRGRWSTTDWEIESAHFAERFQLFIIIALGESIVVTGATASGLEHRLGAARPSRSRFSARPRSGGCTSTTSRDDRAAPARPRRRTRAASRGTPTPTCTSR